MYFACDCVRWKLKLHELDAKPDFIEKMLHGW